jgi:hypothetical protein
MDCLIDLCNSKNPHGCCNTDSCLFIIWSVPLAVITFPIWEPIMCTAGVCNGCIECCSNAKDWSDKNRNNYEVVG